MRLWMKVVAGLIVIVLLVIAALGVGRFMLGFLKMSGTSDFGDPDPMFASEPERVTTPPDLFPEENGRVFEDNSANWDVSVRTPVDKTAEELAREESDS